MKKGLSVGNPRVLGDTAVLSRAYIGAKAIRTAGSVTLNGLATSGGYEASSNPPLHRSRLPGRHLDGLYVGGEAF